MTGRITRTGTSREPTMERETISDVYLVSSTILITGRNSKHNDLVRSSNQTSMSLPYALFDNAPRSPVVPKPGEFRVPEAIDFRLHTAPVHGIGSQTGDWWAQG